MNVTPISSFSFVISFPLSDLQARRLASRAHVPRALHIIDKHRVFPSPVVYHINTTRREQTARLNYEEDVRDAPLAGEEAKDKLQRVFVPTDTPPTPLPVIGESYARMRWYVPRRPRERALGQALERKTRREKRREGGKTASFEEKTLDRRWSFAPRRREERSFLPTSVEFAGLRRLPLLFRPIPPPPPFCLSAGDQFSPRERGTTSGKGHREKRENAKRKSKRNGKRQKCKVRISPCDLALSRAYIYTRAPTRRARPYALSFRVD